MGHIFSKRLYKATCGVKSVVSESLSLFTDSAGSSGYDAFFDGKWSAESWPDSWIQRDLNKISIRT